MLCCTFAGHRQIFHPDVDKQVEDVLSSLLKNDSEFQFLLGGMGEFDLLCARVILRMKQNHSEKQIQSILVEPYMKQSINAEGRWLYQLYDDIIVPEELAGLHYKAAITRRNQWMVEHSQHLIAYVHRDFGGAFSALRYARRRGLVISLV